MERMLHFERLQLQLPLLTANVTHLEEDVVGRIEARKGRIDPNVGLG